MPARGHDPARFARLGASGLGIQDRAAGALEVHQVRERRPDAPQTETLPHAQAEVDIVVPDRQPVLVHAAGFEIGLPLDDQAGAGDRGHGTDNAPQAGQFATRLTLESMQRLASRRREVDAAVLQPPVGIPESRTGNADAGAHHVRYELPQPSLAHCLDVIVEKAQDLATRTARGKIVEMSPVERARRP